MLCLSGLPFLLRLGPLRSHALHRHMANFPGVAERGLKAESDLFVALRFSFNGVFFMARNPKLLLARTYPNVTHKLRAISEPHILPLLLSHPPGSDSVKLTCSCGVVYAPQWGQKLHFEYTPIKSLDGQIWAPAGIYLPCPSCGNPNLLSFPKPAFEASHVTLFGDETSEQIGKDALFYAYCFVQFSPYFREKLRALSEHADLIEDSI